MPTYYKAFNHDLTGWNDYQFAPGETFTDEEGLYYADTISKCLATYNDPDSRVFEVQIDGPCYKRIDFDGSVAYQAKSITLLRELSKAEIADILIAENCSLERAVLFGLDFETLCRFKRQKLTSDQQYAIQQSRYLTTEEKIQLLKRHKKAWFR